MNQISSMFKYDDTEKMVQNIRFIDFQVSRYSSPVLDIMYFIFTSTTRELRGRNYNIYLKTYHETLSDLILRWEGTLIDFINEKYEIIC